jgi:hypothetical protein
MAITHLYGSLSKNITDIVKGGGCPEIKPPYKRYSVLRYFSKLVHDSIAGATGAVGDGGIFNHTGQGVFASSDTFNGKASNGSWEQFVYETYNLNLNAPVVSGGGIANEYRGLQSNSEIFHGELNALNICNQKEIVPITSMENSIHNIELANDIIEKDVDGYYNYNLLKKDHTMDIIPAGASVPVSKTADLMEFVYLHSFIPKCRSGELYLELIDFNLTGTVTNDYLIHIYYWEDTSDSADIATALRNRNALLADSDDFLSTDNENILVKVLKSSDLQGTGTDNKLIVWLNKLKTTQEKFGVNVLIGFSPQEVRRDEAVTLYDASRVVVTTDQCADIILKFKNANIRTKKMSTSINSLPICYPSFGFKDLDGGTLGGVVVSTYDIKIQLLNSSNIPVNNYGAPGATGTYHGIKNGGADASNSFLTEAISYSSAPGYGNWLGFPSMFFLDGKLAQFSIVKFFCIPAALNPADTYIMRLPNTTDIFGQKINVRGTSYNYDTVKDCFPYDPVTRTSYMHSYDSFPTDYSIKIYAGDDVYTSGGYPLYKDFVDGLTLIKTLTPTEMGQSFVEINSGEDYYLANPLSPTPDQNIATPYFIHEKIYIKKNKYKYFTFLGSDLPAIYPCYFYILLCKDGVDIKNINYGVTVDTSEAGGDPAYYWYYPSGYGSTYAHNVTDSCGDIVSTTYTGTVPTTTETAGFDMSPEYGRAFDDNAVSPTISRLYRNFGAMVYKAPQIIAKTAQPTAENYYS